MSRAALLAEASAWLDIAERIDESYEPCYLCWFVDPVDYCVSDRIQEWPETRALRERMKDRIRRHLAGQGEIDNGDAPRNIRVLAAMFLALECESEAAELKASPSGRSKQRASNG